jgi:hypothetical protein
MTKPNPSRETVPLNTIGHTGINFHLWLRRSGRRVRQVAPTGLRGEASPVAPPEAEKRAVPEAGNQGAPAAEDDRRMVLRNAVAEPRSGDTAPAVQHTWKRTYFLLFLAFSYMVRENHAT